MRVFISSNWAASLGAAAAGAAAVSTGTGLATGFGALVAGRETALSGLRSGITGLREAPSALESAATATLLPGVPFVPHQPTPERRRGCGAMCGRGGGTMCGGPVRVIAGFLGHARPLQQRAHERDHRVDAARPDLADLAMAFVIPHEDAVVGPG